MEVASERNLTLGIVLNQIHRRYEIHVCERIKQTKVCLFRANNSLLHLKKKSIFFPFKRLDPEKGRLIKDTDIPSSISQTPHPQISSKRSKERWKLGKGHVNTGKSLIQWQKLWKVELEVTYATKKAVGPSRRYNRRSWVSQRARNKKASNRSLGRSGSNQW